MLCRRESGRCKANVYIKRGTPPRGSMAFIFDSIKNNTYLVFCMCLQFVLVYCYSLVFFPETDLLAKDLVVCGLMWQAILFVFYMLNFVAFDVEKYTKSKKKDDSESGDEHAKEPENTGPNIYIGILLNVVCCEVIVFASFCTVWIVSLVECTQSSRSVLCYTTWGKHPANVGVAGAVLLVSLSLFFSTLVLYKQHMQGHGFLSKYAENYIAIYSLLVCITLKSKMVGYNVKCVAEKSIMWDSNIPEYAGFVVLILSQFIASLLVHKKHRRDKSAAAARRRKKAHVYADVGGVHTISVLPRMVAIAIVALNFVNVFEFSMVLNVTHGVLLVVLCGVLVHPFLCRTLFDKHKLS